MSQGVDAYRSVATQSQTPREHEAYLLLKSARFLQDVLDSWEERQDELSAALDYYRKLWVFLSTSVTREENPLPREIKQNIANLAVFCISRSLESMWQKDETKIRQLVFINKQIAAGLRGSASDEHDAQMRAQSQQS